MNTKNRQIVKQENMIYPQLQELHHINGSGLAYDLSYWIGYSFAMMTDFMGDHTSKYGLAFK